MAKDKVGSLHVELDASADKLGSELNKAGQSIEKFSKKARQHLGDIDRRGNAAEPQGFLGRLGRRAKETRAEAHKTGESALEAYLGGGISGMLAFGLESAGVGIAAMVVEKVVHGFTEGAKTATESIRRYRTGQMGSGELIESLAGRVPVLGDIWLSPWLAGDLLAEITGNERWMSPATREKREREGWERIQDAKSTYMASDFARRAAGFTPGSIGRAKTELLASREKAGEEFVKQMIELEISSLNWVDKATTKAFLGQSYQNQFRASLAQEEQLQQNLGIERRGFSATALGGLGGVLGAFRELPGGDNPEAQKLSRLISVYSQAAGLRSVFAGILASSDATADQKAAATAGRQALRQWVDLATGSKNLNMRPYEPLRFPGADSGVFFGGGAADLMREQDQADYANNASLADNQKKTNDILTKISDALTEALQNFSAPDVLDNIGVPP